MIKILTEHPTAKQLKSKRGGHPYYVIMEDEVIGGKETTWMSLYLGDGMCKAFDLNFLRKEDPEAHKQEVLEGWEREMKQYGHYPYEG